MNPYRKGKEAQPEPRIGKCPDCGSPDVLLLPYRYPDPYWDDDPDYPPVGPQKMLLGWKCELCKDAPKDPRQAVCFIGNMILKALAKSSV